MRSLITRKSSEKSILYFHLILWLAILVTNFLEIDSTLCQSSGQLDERTKYIHSSPPDPNSKRKSKPQSDLDTCLYSKSSAVDTNGNGFRDEIENHLKELIHIFSNPGGASLV